MFYSSSYLKARMLLVALLVSFPLLTTAADTVKSLGTEGDSIAVLKSTAPPSDKAIACKRLAIIGSPAAVPSLAPLLTDKDLASWARTALEAIPGPEAATALREAMSRTEGLLLVGVLNSIGNRRDSKALNGLTTHLNSNDAQVIAAAAVALGRIGGPDAAQALEAALKQTTGTAQKSVAEGCILCAEGFLATGNSREAIRLYDQVRQTAAFQPRVLEATRGAILARGADGLPLLLEQLRTDDKELLNVGLRTARELPGREVTEALVAEVSRATPQRQGLLLRAVGDRDDPVVLPAVTKLARTASPAVRIVAVSILENKGHLDSLPVLLAAAIDDHAELASSAQVALARFGGAEVDAALITQLDTANGKLLQVLIELAGLRGIERAVPDVVPYLSDSDPGIRRASITTLGALGQAAQLPALIQVLPQADHPRDRADLERALASIAGREGSPSVPQLLPLLSDQNVKARIIGLHALAAAGGAQALTAVVLATRDNDETVQDEAVRTLVSWPNTWPDDDAVAAPLLTLAKSSQKTSHQLQGLRGYLQFLRESRAMNRAQKMSAVEAVMPLVKRPEEKRLVISVLSTVPSADALELLMSFTDDPTITEEACLAIVKIATGPGLKSGSANQVRKQALQAVIDRSQNASTRKEAKELQ